MSSKNKPVNWGAVADAIDGMTDEEWEASMAELNSGPSAGEEVEYALKRFQAMGLMPMDEDEDDG